VQPLLVVEDDPGIRRSLAEALEDEGYSVVLAANGREAIDRLREQPTPCMILLDLMMPIMDGWEFLRARRENEDLAAIPVVVVSAYADKVKTVEAEHFIQKPIDLARLLAVVTRYCDC
jgi:CheY-like chemotaxis protein